MAGIMTCVRCGSIGEPDRKLKGSGWITFLLLFVYIVPGLIYMIWRRSGNTLACKKCGSHNIVPADSPRAHAIGGATPDTHVKCPDCRELVLRDARRCKHCGCALIPQ